MKKLAIILTFYLLSLEIYSQMNWPLPSYTSQHNIPGTTGEYRQTNRFHQGLDITNGNNYNVYAIETGTASYTPSGVNSYITVTNGNGSILYIHINPSDTNSRPVIAGQLIGTMLNQGAIHLHLQSATYNFLSSHLYPFVDNVAPTIFSVNFRQNGFTLTNVTPSFTTQININSQNHTLIYNKIDIDAKVSSPGIATNGGANGNTVAPYSVSYEVKDYANTSVDGSPVENIKFEQIPLNAAASNVFGNGTSFSPAIYYYILTSHPNTMPYARYWNTGIKNGVTENWQNNTSLDARSNDEAHYPDGQYTIPIVAKDIDYNQNPSLITQQTARVLIDNFRPYIKSVQMLSGSLIYDASWVWNSSPGQLNFNPNAQSGIASGANNLVITLNTSEPMQSVSINISTLGYTNTSTTPVSNTNSKQWIFTIPSSTISVASSCNHTLSISGSDLAGNPIQSNPTIIPKRNLSGTWSPAPVIGNDTYHGFTTGSGLPLTLSSTNATAPNFNNGTATVSAPGAITYLWSNSQTTATISNLVPGTYSVTVSSSSGCSAIGTITVLSDLTPTYCSGTTSLTAPSGYFNDGSSNNNYGDNSNCSWLIQPANAASISLSFSSFNTEANNDVITVYDGATTFAAILATYSGSTIPNSITSSGGAMLVKFTSNGSISNAGWDASYSSIINATNCFSPIVLNAYNLTSYSAYLNWSTVTNAQSYQYRYKLTGGSNWTNGYSNVSNYQLSNLSACSEYEYQIRSVCATNDTSSYSTSLYFSSTGCPDSTNNGAVNIVAYQYWFDNNFANNQYITIPVQSVFNLVANLDVTTLSLGLHSIHIRFIDDNGTWSSVTSQFFVKPPVPVSPNNIVAYEYWFDSDYAGKVNISVSPVSSFTLTGNISANVLANGLHSFHIRFRDTNSRYSSVISQFFIKQSGGVYPTNLITKYRYWFNMADSAMITVNIPTPINQYQLVQNICTGNLPVGNHTIHFQFKDSLQAWSSVLTDTFSKSTPTFPVITASGSTTFCQGNLVTLTASVGNSYLWNNGAITQSITVSSSGNYSVTVDNGSGCSLTSNTVTVTINPLPSTPTITQSGATTFCQGNSVTLTTSSATSYLWSNSATTQSITVSASGNFSVIVTDGNGCSATSTPTSVTINPLPSTPTITPSGATAFCQGNSVTLTTSSATSYLWSNSATTQSITVSASGNYSVTVTDGNGCSATSTPTPVTVNPLPTATITPNGATTFCQGNSVTLSASSATSYLWSNSATTQSITVSATGNYSVTVTDGNVCSATSLATTVTVNTPQNNLTITLNNNTLTSPYSQQNYWYLTGNSNQIDSGLNHICSQSGNYFVVGLDANGCTATSDTLNVNCIPTDIMPMTNLTKLQVYPNPTSSILNIVGTDIDNGTYKFALKNVIGQIIFENSFIIENNFIRKTFSISELPGGIYFLTIETEKIKTVVKVSKMN